MYFSGQPTLITISMKPTCILLLLFLISTTALSQAFVTVDNDTFEIIEDVDYSLYKQKQLVHHGITAHDTATFVDEKIVFDSIAFSRVDYESKGFLRKHWDSVVFLSKKTIYLDEVVIGGKEDKGIILGETNRFVKRRSRPLSRDLDYGLILYNGYPYKLQVDKIAFFVEKVKFKTAYKINFSEVNETVSRGSNQFALPGTVFYSSGIRYLNLKGRGRVEVNLPEFYMPSTKKVFVWIQLLDYYDNNDLIITPDLDEQTEVKFQLSDKMNYYTRMSDLHTHKLSEELINSNFMITYDFTNIFFTTPHKSDLVAPAIVLYAHKVEMKPVGISNKL